MCRECGDIRIVYKILGESLNEIYHFEDLSVDVTVHTSKTAVKEEWWE
jgi:hypothetical protein